jgi:mono/diheme cytochrome c family protein
LPREALALKTGRHVVYAAAIPRFSTLAISSVILLTLTVFYAAWLEVGNLHTLRETAYGQTLIVKLGLLVPLLLLGAVNLLIIGPRLQRSAPTGIQFGRTIAAEAFLGILVLLVVGVLTSLPTAREALTAQVGKSSFHFFHDGVHVVFQVTPAAVGPNRYTADIGLEKGELPAGTEVLLRVSRQGDVEGERQISLAPVQGGRFEATGSELSVVGTWQLELIVRRPNQVDWTAKTPIDIAKTPPAAQLPGPPPRFAGFTAAAGVLLLGIAIAVSVVGLRRRKGDRFLVEIGGGLLLISVVALAVTWVPQSASAELKNPIPMSATSIAAGRALFQTNCVACHGADARGDGPMAQTLKPRPADLTASHVDIHTDGDLYGWIKNGYPGSSMPGFGKQLSDDQIWQLVNYVRSLRHPIQGTGP